MDISYTELALAATASLAPHLPKLLNVGEFAANALGEMVVQGVAAKGWEKAKTLWGKLLDKFGNDPEINSAAKLVATQPKDETRLTLLAEILHARLQNDPELVTDVLAILGGQSAVQQVIAENGSWIEDVEQRIVGSGEQIIQADRSSTIRSVRQNINAPESD